MKIGDRAGAICGSVGKTVRFFGYGTYGGEEIPPPGITFLGLDLHEMEHYNPKIVLDSGDVVWGCECWWGTEEKVKKMLEGMTIVHITPEEFRKEKAEAEKNTGTAR